MRTRQKTRSGEREKEGERGREKGKGGGAKSNPQLSFVVMALANSTNRSKSISA